LIEKAALVTCCGELLSPTVTVKLNVPVFVGVPVIFPELLKVRPGGRQPVARLHVSGAFPPVAVNV